MIVILTEKPSQARNFGSALGGMSGTYKGEAYTIANARGHLYEFDDPEKMVPADFYYKYKSWELENLPWDASLFSWKRVPKEGTGTLLKALKTVLKTASEICIATDIDPTGEGQLIGWEIIDGLGFKNKKITRMYFLDESASEIQKAFVNRKRLPPMEMDPEYLKAIYRDKWDFMSMQFTRIATKCGDGKVVLRQGRLKSAMVLLVGDQLKAIAEYKKVPSYENRFRDENGNVFTNPDEPKFPKKDQVPSGYKPSAVKVTGRTEKTTGPKRLMDLAELSSILAARGIKADVTLKTYQKMYEAQLVSYPRTEDKCITPEQFAELLPLADKIADLVGVDKALLTHRKPRASHVKTGGAHGANRPGKRVPASLDSLDKYGPGAQDIYKLLARSYLSMLAEDYVYIQEKGELVSYPVFKASVNIPKSQGWKAVLYSRDNPEDGPEEASRGLGQKADPFIYEGFPPKPTQPTMKWLMKQLEKHDVGTGATRTSTYADVTSSKAKYPLLGEKRGKITMTQYGEMSYRLLPGTRIGQLTLTENLYSEMKAISEGKAKGNELILNVADHVKHDLEQMAKNGQTMRKEMKIKMAENKQQKEKFQGVWTETGGNISFNRTWGGYRFSDEECQALLDGEEIELNGWTDKSGAGARGKLAAQEFKGHKYIGFERTEFIKD